MTAISIIMPCYNRAYDLLRVLKRYDEQDTRQPFELIAVDDASRDRTYEVLCAYRPQNYQLTVLRQEQNMGPADARNRGITVAQAPILLFVGDDILPEVDFVRLHLEAHQSRPAVETAILGRVMWGQDIPVNTLMQHIDGEGAQQFSYFYFRDGQEYDFRHFYTCNISVKRELLFSEPHWFDSDFPSAGYEDAELGYRLAKRGMHIHFASQILAYHYHYHTIWSFSNRQFLAGLSSRILVRKQPELRFHPSFRGHYRRMLAMLRRTGLKPISVEMAERSESLACHLASFYEWLPTPLVGSLYMPVLDYFFYKGVLKTVLGEQSYSRWGRGAHAQVYLQPALKSFITQAIEEKLPLPGGVDENSI
jgi:glycosyltransferase involved in cell wall biosynthesis